MNRLISSAAAMSLFILVAASPANSATTSLDGVIETAQQSISNGQSKRAEAALKKALASTDGTKDATFARAQVLYATALRQSGKFGDASEALAEALATYKTLGSVDPAYIEELKVLAPNFQSIELEILRGAANSLKNNSATVTMEKTATGGHVEIKMPTPMESSLNNAKVDGVQLDKLVYFDIESSDPNAIHLSGIKGFRIHSVEKNTWVNLIDLKTGALDAEGKYDATIVAGKAGITKTVPAKLPLKAAEPILGLAEQLQRFGAVPQIDLPIAVAKPVETPVTTTPVVVDTAVTTPAAVVPTTSTPVVVDTAVRTPAAVVPPTSTPVIVDTAVATPAAVSTTTTAIIQTEVPVTRTVETTAPGWDNRPVNTTVIQTPVSPVDDVQITRTEPTAVKTEPAKTESTKTESTKTESTKTESTKPQPRSSTSTNRDGDDDDKDDDHKDHDDKDDDDKNDKNDNNDDSKNNRD